MQVVSVETPHNANRLTIIVVIAALLPDNLAL